MDDPIKIVFKYKNNNGKYQHHIYIFVGDVPSTILSILKKIRDKTFIESLLLLESKEYKKLIDFYGEFWYKKFFNTFHVEYMIKQIKNNTTRVKSLMNKYGKEWYAKHIKEFNLVEKSLVYSYAADIRSKLEKIEMKKTNRNIDDDEDDNDYTTKQSRQFGSLSGGDLSGLSDDYIRNQIMDICGGNVDESPEEIEVIDNFDGEEQGELMFGEDLNIEDIEKLYQDVELDQNSQKTSNLIKTALKDDKILKKTKSGMVEFDDSKDNVLYDENLRDVYHKYYVTSQYIFKDDTIKMIKNKICCSIKNNKKFEKDSFLIPSKQYLFSEYLFNDKIDRVMIGQKWIQRTSLLKIDIEPNANIRYYEELRGSLKYLKDNIKRYGSKIKWDDDDSNILYDYSDYIMNNEVYILDIYNELGKNYNPDPEALKNITDVYIKVYFPKVKSDDIKYMLSYLGNNTKIESSKNYAIYENINNDLILENQIMMTVENVKKDNNYTKLFRENYITQSVIHVNLKKNNEKLDLYHIFNDFVVTEEYPFIQYFTIDGQIIFKYSEQDILEFSSKKDNINILSKWFQNAPYGISFKVQIMEKGIKKYMAINLNENGRIEYKTQWKESDTATIDNVKNTYSFIKNLIKKINKETKKVKFDIPKDYEFDYAFINSIQQFVLPKEINHNDLSDFSRYFYPYVALVIEPRKRKSKIKKEEITSKYGTYLRYKRISKYENKAKIEQRILYFMRNYDYNDKSLASEIGKQFNITEEDAIEHINNVRMKYPNIKKSRKVLKKLENVPKYKPPGIDVDIQGRSEDKYKIRISGARNKEQLDRIIDFMNVLIFLYTETYILKKPDRQMLKEKLKKLTNIAKRRHKVEHFVKNVNGIRNVKKLTKVDKTRLGFKPEKGQNQWSRSCQNSGTEKRRQPALYKTVEQLISEGFKLDKTTGIYEKKIRIKDKNNKMKQVTIRAVGLEELDSEEGGLLYYSCNPKENGEHMFIGFLSRSTSPHGEAMPCCFKKDPLESNNKLKMDAFFRSIGKTRQKDDSASSEPAMLGEILYILQDTNKIQEGRIGFLPKYLDLFFNQFQGNTRTIKQHYLVKTDSYYFKYGAKQDEYHFFNAVGAMLNMNVTEIKAKIIKALEDDKQNAIFTALNNGDIRTKYETRENFINFIRISPHLDFDIFNHFFSMPKILKKSGINIIVFEKKTIIIEKTLEKESRRDDFVLLCQNTEESDNIKDMERDNIILMKEGRYYYPIVKVEKKDQDNKDVTIQKTFKYIKNPDNLIYNVSDFYEYNCKLDNIDISAYKKNNPIAKIVYQKLNELNNKNYKPRYQIIDSRNKCKYIITENSTIIPTNPSGSVYQMPILKHMSNKHLSFDATYKNLQELSKLTKGILHINPIGVYYTSKTKENVKIIAIMTELYSSIPIIEQTVSLKSLENKNLIIENKPLFDKIDEEINKGDDNLVIDERIKKINYDEYYSESYELFRLELSKYLSDPDNVNARNKIVKIIKDKKAIKREKISRIQEFLYRVIDKRLFDLFKNTQSGGKYNKFVHIGKTDIKDYTIKNSRQVCSINTDREKCNNNPHCRWSHDNCYFTLSEKLIIHFINKVSDELINNELKGNEILQNDNYFVSDIANYNIFKERKGQRIMKNTNTNINSMLVDIFGKDNVPKIGKRYSYRTTDIDLLGMNADNPMHDFGEYTVQKVIDNNLTIFRSYANGYNWIKNKLYDFENRNLGYYSSLQTDMANYFKSIVIDWLIDNNNEQTIRNNLLEYLGAYKNTTKSTQDIVMEFINKISRDVNTSSTGIVELYVLSVLFSIPIIIYDDLNNILFAFDNGVLYDSYKNKINTNKYKQADVARNSVNIKFALTEKYAIPTDIETIYYK